MRVLYHPVADNPIRMSYVPGWQSVHTLRQRLEELEVEVRGSRVIPAPWEPYSHDCLCCRDTAADAWSWSRLQYPEEFAVDLALFCGDGPTPATAIGRALWLMLCTKREPSRVTREMMVAEALEVWKNQAEDWLRQVVVTCAKLGVETSPERLREPVEHALSLLEHVIQFGDELGQMSGLTDDSGAGGGFDKGGGNK